MCYFSTLHLRVGLSFCLDKVQIITFSVTNFILFSAFRDDKIDSVSDYEPVKHHSYGSKYSDFDTLGSPGK